MLSAKSLAARGSISPKQMQKLAVLRGTRSQKSKMAPFEHKDKDEGQAHGKGHPDYSVDEINERATQRRCTAGRVSKGGQARGGTEPHSGHINYGAFGKPAFPPGSKVSAKNPKTGNTRMKGKIPAQGGLYGGGGRNTQ